MDTGLASSVSGALLPTEDPFLYTVSSTLNDGVEPAALEAAALEVLDAVRLAGITPDELARARHQLRARFVFEADSVTNIAHQIGYFHTIGALDLYRSLDARLAEVTIEEVASAALRYLHAGNRTVGWFRPIRDGEPRA